MSRKIRISPVTRINGFWNLEVLVEGGEITDAWSSGIFFRGLEEILLGRDPRDAAYLTERICGICSTAHALAAARALEDALNIQLPKNAVLLRNISFGADLLQNHIRHFYLLTILDFVKGPDCPPFVPRYEGDYRLNKAETDRLVESYRHHFEAARLTHEMVTVFGGKAPHQHGIVPGGFTSHPTVDKIQKVMGMLDLVAAFIRDRMQPDAQLLAKRYEDYYSIGSGHQNLLSYGNFPMAASPGRFEIPSGVYTEGRMEEFKPERITEYVHRAWYDRDRESPQHPAAGITVPNPDKKDGYSWVKAPRYDGKPFETGPLAHLWMKGDYRRGISTMDRIMARVLEAGMVADLMKQWLNELEPGRPVYQPYEIPEQELAGVGLTGAMRGALGHWIKIKNKRIVHYQIITPSAWVCGPRDGKGVRGPVEEALVGTPVADPANPVEIGRVARSFDPCLACAVHLITIDGTRLTFQIAN